jgi:hypothetical protein
MEQNKTLREFLKQKIERQAILKEKAAMLEEIDLELFSSKFGRWFGSTYLGIKRLILLLLGLAIIVISFAFLFFPEIVLSNHELRAEMIQDSRDYYSEMAGQTLDEAIVLLARSGSELTTEQVIEQLDIAYTKSLEEELIFSVQFFAVLLLLLAITLLYISRLTRKMRSRNRKITQAETLSQDIIFLFQESISYGEKELELLQRFMSGSESKGGGD